MDMLKKMVSFILTFLIIFYIAIPTYADDTSLVSCYVNDEGKVTIEWESAKSITELRISRSGDIFKSFTLGIPHKGNYTFTETEAGSYTYKVVLFGENNKVLASSDDCSVIGNGKPTIWLDFINAESGKTKTERIRNWVNIKNLGTSDLKLSELMIRYFYTIDGEPTIVKDTYVNNGQQKAEESDGKINPIETFDEYPLGRKNIQVKESIRMNFIKIPFNVTNEDNTIVADYVCETYFEGTTEILNSGYFLKLQPAFDKKNLTNPEYGSIRDYDLTNDFSFNNNKNIAVYYGDKKIWGLDPTIIAPRNLKGEYINFRIELDWEDSPGASGYTVYRSESIDGIFEKKAVNIQQSNYTDTDVEKPNQTVGKIYYYKVVANYNKLVSDDSNIVGVEVSELKAPANLTASVIDNKNVRLEWDASVGATKYNVYRSDSENGVYLKIKSDVTENNFIDHIDEQQPLKKTYYYKVKAIVEYNGATIESDFSNFADATVINLPIPKDLTAKVVNTKDVELEWTKAGGATGYTIFRSDSEDGSYEPIKTVSDVNTYVDKSITLINDLKDYYYKVSAIYNIDDSIIPSDKSDSAPVTMPRKKLEAPKNLKATQYQGTKVLLDWTPSAGAKKYIIYRSEHKDTGFIPIATIDAIDADGNPVFLYVDIDVPKVTDSVGKNFYYKMVATYDDENDQSEDSDVAEVMITVYIGGSNDYFDWFCRVISSKGKSDFVLGTYIPVSFTVTINKDVDYLNLVLDEKLINPQNDNKNKNNFNLNTSIVSLKNGSDKKLIKTTITNSFLTDFIIDWYVSIPVVIKPEDTAQNIFINRKFKQGDVIYLEFAIKSSANEKVIGDGIEKYYGDKYDLSFEMEAKDTLTGEEITKSAASSDGTRLNIKILEPNKLQ